MSAPGEQMLLWYEIDVSALKFSISYIYGRISSYVSFC